MTQGSTPWGRISAGLAQLAARLFRNQKAIGSDQSGFPTDLKPPADRSRAQRKGNLRFPERGAARTQIAFLISDIRLCGLSWSGSTMAS